MGSGGARPRRTSAWLHSTRKGGHARCARSARYGATVWCHRVYHTVRRAGGTQCRHGATRSLCYGAYDCNLTRPKLTCCSQQTQLQLKQAPQGRFRGSQGPVTPIYLRPGPPAPTRWAPYGGTITIRCHRAHHTVPAADTLPTLINSAPNHVS